MNPIVVIATHNRIEITTRNIESLLKQSIKPIIICSDELECHSWFQQYEIHDKITLLKVANNPLGNKWQAGVNLARELKADPLIILGSDDLLHRDYIKDGLTKLEEYGLVGTTSWYNYDVKSRTMYSCSYSNMNVNFPIGSGKMYSKKALDIIGWKVFDTNANVKLDDLGFQSVKRKNIKIYLSREPKILAVKGDWPVLNSTDKYLTGPNIISNKVEAEPILKEFEY